MKKEFLTRLSVCVVCPSLFLSSVLVFGLFEIFIYSFFTCIEKFTNISTHNTQKEKRKEKKRLLLYLYLKNAFIFFSFPLHFLARIFARICARI